MNQQTTAEPTAKPAEAKTTPAPGTPEHDAAMAALYESQGKPAQADAEPAAPTTAPQRPEGVPEKFWDAEKGQVNQEALLKAYTELEKSKSKPAEAKPAEPTKPAEEGKPAEASPLASVTMESLGAEIFTEGGLKAETKDLLVKAGLQATLVDQLVDVVKMAAEKQVSDMHSHVGGKKEFDTLVEWGKKNLDEKSREFFDTQLNSEHWRDALDLLKLRHSQKAMPSQPGVVDTGAASLPSVEAYASREEMVRDINNPLYRADPAFRAKVQRKIALAKF